MEARMHALEDALAIVNAADSNRPHPLLDGSFVLEDEDEDPDDPILKPIQETQDKPSSALTDGLGTLYIDDEDGATRFFGPSGGSEVRLHCVPILSDISSIIVFRACYW